MLDDTRGRRELSSALWVLQGAAWWLGVLCLVLWSGGKARRRFVVDRGPDGQPLPDGAHLAPNVLRTGALLLLYTSLATAHVFMVVRLIGPGPLLRGDRLVQDDYSYHLSSVIRVREFFVESGRLWGLQPGAHGGAFLPAPWTARATALPRAPWHSSVGCWQRKPLLYF